MKPYRFLSPARVELYEIASYYESEAHGLGGEFMDVLIAALTLLRERPATAAPHRAGTKRFVLPRFPYSLVVLDEPEELIIVAIAHHRREPGYWTKRL